MLVKINPFSEIEIIVKNRNCRQKSKFSLKIEIFVKTEILICNFGTIEMLIQNRNLCEKLLLSIIEMFANNRKFSQIWKIPIQS